MYLTRRVLALACLLRYTNIKFSLSHRTGKIARALVPGSSYQPINKLLLPCASFSTAILRQRLVSLSRLVCHPISSTSGFSRNMSSKPDVDHADIAQMKSEKDGSYKRLDSTFRSSIATGSKFEPEAGTSP